MPQCGVELITIEEKKREENSIEGGNNSAGNDPAEFLFTF